MTSRYETIEPIQKPIPAERQAAKRHYGVHPYFTRRPANVVARYILHYSREHDTVLDPFGGSGVTAIEAYLENRAGIHNDINPLANFIARGIVDLSRGCIDEYRNALAVLEDQCATQLGRLSRLDDASLSALLKRLPLPPNLTLPRTSDAENYHALFTPRQLASLTLIRQAIDKLPKGAAREAMLLAWSATLTKLNKTFLSAEGRAESRGGSSIFSIYRYKVAAQPVELGPWPTFNERAHNVIEAKEEIDKLIEVKRRTSGWSGKFVVRACDVSELAEEFNNSIDYIFTDPPYGGHISYLDLSSLWNVWLGHKIPSRTRGQELIVGGELNLSESVYVHRLGESVKSCLRMLKKGRWMSIVFQHWNVEYFKAILSSAADSGAELKAAVSQVGDPIWSMHKKKGNVSVLAGEMILTFFKNGRAPNHKRMPFDISHTLDSILISCPAVAYGEYIFNRLVIEAWRKAAIDSLDISKEDFAMLMQERGWEYDEKNHYWMKERSANPLGLTRG